MKSEIVKALEEQGRLYSDIDVTGFVGIGNKPLPKIRFVVPVLKEQRDALIRAHERVGKECGTTGAKDDPDVLDNEKLLCIAYEACRNPDDIKERVFGSPGWMDQWLAPEQITYLVNVLNEVRYEKNTAKPTFGKEALDLVMRLCDDGAGSDVPGAMFAAYDRAWLTHALVCMSLRVRELESQLRSYEDR